jgi:hypothetical protein
MNPTASRLPEPRSYAGTAIVLAGLTALPFGVLWSWLFSAMRHRSFGETLPFGLIAGLLFELCFGLGRAVLFQGATTTVDVSDRKGFVATLNVAAAQLGFHPVSTSDGFFTFKPSFQSGPAAGGISDQLTEGHAVLVGPGMYVQNLIRRLGAG